jgi:hypothetical protein
MILQRLLLSVCTKVLYMCFDGGKRWRIKGSDSGRQNMKIDEGSCMKGKSFLELGKATAQLSGFLLVHRSTSSK